jgi:hypothetical protein
LGVVCKWFLCFDDDDPDELVIFEKTGAKFMAPEEVIRENHLPFIKPRKACRAIRCVIGGKGTAEAQSWWVEMTAPIPSKLIVDHDGIVKGDIKKQGQGVYHGYSFYEEKNV